MRIPTELVEACRRGDQRAFEELVRLTHKPVFSLVSRIVGNREDAADVTQEVYVRVWRGLRHFRGESDAGTWLYRVASNTALSHVRRRVRHRQVEGPIEDLQLPVADRTEQLDDAQMLESALGRLPPEQRAAVVLKDVYGWSCAEIAKRMGTSEGAIKVRLFRARQRLADHLDGDNVVVPMRRRKRP